MSNRGLIVIDVQNIFFNDADAKLYNADEVVANINDLIENARQNNVKIFFVRHEADYMKNGSVEWEIYDAIDARKTDFYVEKKTPDSFYETRLQELLEREAVGEIYLCGFQTEYCIDTTCRSAFGRKIKAFLVEDAHSTFDAKFIKAENIIKHHNKIIGNWFAGLVATNKISFQKVLSEVS